MAIIGVGNHRIHRPCGRACVAPTDPAAELLARPPHLMLRAPFFAPLLTTPTASEVRAHFLPLPLAANLARLSGIQQAAVGKQPLRFLPIFLLRVRELPYISDSIDFAMCRT